MSSNSKQHQTPAWKINLTQSFNMLSNKIRGHKPILNFEQQLQQKLSILPSKQQLSSNGKGIKRSIQIQSYNNNEFNKPSVFDLSQVENSPLKLNFNQDCQPKQQKGWPKQQNEQVEYGVFNIFTDSQVKQLLFQYFQSSSDIYLKDFIQICCKKYYQNKHFSQQFKKMLQQQTKSIFCTTNENIISLNAIQMITKKTKLKLILQQKILYIKYKQRKRNLQKQYQQILNQIIQEKNNIQQQNQILDKRKKNIQDREKQLIKKEKAIKTHQKQIVQKEKVFKKIIQQKSHKAIADMVQKLQKITDKIDKKAGVFERNARNKLELIQKRVIDYRSTLKNVPQKDLTHQDSMIKKMNTQILTLKSKLKKHDKQYESTREKLQKEVVELQNQSRSLLKANTILQNKLQKQKQKMQCHIQSSQSKTQNIHQLQMQIEQKSNKIQQLQAIMQNINNKDLNNLLRIESDIKGDKSSRSNKKTKNLHHKNQCRNCQQVINVFNSIISIILHNKGNHNIKYQQNIKSKQNIKFKIQEYLINQSYQLFILLSKLLWIAMQLNYFNISSIIQFMLQLSLSKCSFLRFQCINQILQNQTNEVQNYIQKLQVYSIGKDELQYLFKISLNYIQCYRQNSSKKEIIHLLLVLCMAGLNQSFDKTTNKSTPTLKLLLTQFSKPSQQSCSIVSSQQTITFLLPKYLSYSSSPIQKSILIDILLQVYNYENENNQTKQVHLLKSILALKNYQYLFNYLIIHFNQYGKDKIGKDVLDNVVVLLQRFCYQFYQQVYISQNDLNNLKKIYLKLNQQQLQTNIFFTSNIQNILSNFIQFQ